jgi:hypothetical protein
MSPLLFAKMGQHIAYQLPSYIKKNALCRGGKEAQLAAVDTADFSPERPRECDIIVTH